MPEGSLHYEVMASLYDQSRHSIFYRHVAEILCSMAKKHVDPKSVLDLGCGTGFSTLEISKFFPEAEIFAVDASSAMLAVARAKRFGEKVSFYNEQAGNLARLARKFDLIISSMSFHWLSPKDRLALRDALQEKGILALAFPLTTPFTKKSGNSLLWDIFRRVKAYDRKWRPSRHTRGASWKEIGKSLPDLKLLESLCYYLEEEFSRGTDFIEILKVRGVLLSLFGAKADTAESLMVEAADGTSGISYLWPVGLAIVQRVSGRGNDEPGTSVL